ncbi:MULTISPECIES: amidohydrolase family protein [unclassified Pseudofrankia]|uniref:amidohydrolase family protein n=1 Tax=unclassified Pseudofrankia TaxID=2994372 RepID=UPI0008D9C40C|nr:MULTISPECIES: amidohydrolase family protein [unclassified Pseudofrankia]MDT3440174.1 amidohydrolase family protein [Pseudofrankia sp. BMG5.37]OHV42612.1 amidohydrolase [Pseudofrankia sp. BMG5.36]
MGSRLSFPVFDADNHLYETEDAFTRYLPEQYRSAIEYVDVRGRKKIAIRGVISDYIPNPTFDVVARPGAQEDYFRNGNPEGKSYREIIGKPMRAIPAFREPAPRLELMNELGVDGALMFPTLASLLEERMRDDPELTHVAIHALNEWIHEVWSFDYQSRIFSTPVITLPIVEKAIAELEWVVERGAKVVLVRPAPVPGFRGSRSFGMPEFDPFWKAAEDAGVLVAMHSSDSGYTRYQGDWTGPGEMLPFRPNAFGLVSVGFRPLEDSLAALACENVLSRFPNLKVAVVEAGSEWLPGLFARLADAYKKMPQAFDEHPVDVIRRNVYISPFHEDNLAQLVELMGAEHVMFGSDYPHPEGLAEPCSFIDHLPPGLEQDAVEKIMGGNLAGLLGLGVKV